MEQQQQVFQTLGISLGLGLLVGLQRESSHSRTAGIRTFTLVSLLGTICALLSVQFGGLILAAGFIAIMGILLASNLLKLHQPDPEIGQTTEVAALLMFGIGAYLVLGQQSAAVASAGVLAILLHLKQPMHEFVRKMGEQDLRAIMQFVLISLVILPVLPNRAYGPYQVLNPFDIWRMITLIVGISLSGYVAFKLLPRKHGALLGGILGGIISSTATTVSYARRARAAPDLSPVAAIVIIIASAIAYVRILVEIAAVAPDKFQRLALPIAAMTLWMALLAAITLFTMPSAADPSPDPSNPADLQSALFFGGLYAVVLLIVAAVRHHFGNMALYGVAVLSGLTDVDAITLSTARMVSEDRLGADTGWRIILIASMANLLFKGGAIAALGTRRLTIRVFLLLAAALAGGGLILWLWPKL